MAAMPGWHAVPWRPSRGLASHSSSCPASHVTEPRSHICHPGSSFPPAPRVPGKPPDRLGRVCCGPARTGQYPCTAVGPSSPGRLGATPGRSRAAPFPVLGSQGARSLLQTEGEGWNFTQGTFSAEKHHLSPPGHPTVFQKLLSLASPLRHAGAPFSVLPGRGGHTGPPRGKPWCSQPALPSLAQQRGHLGKALGRRSLRGPLGNMGTFPHPGQRHGKRRSIVPRRAAWPLLPPRGTWQLSVGSSRPYALVTPLQGILG